MATAEVVRTPQERSRRRPFANLVRRFIPSKSPTEQQAKATGGKKAQAKHRKNHFARNNPYPQSGRLPTHEHASQPSFGTRQGTASTSSLPTSTLPDRDGPSNSNKSGAPTLATNAETVHSDAGHSKAATATTGGGALSTIDRAGAGSTFSSPTQSEHSLATTLTTIQSQSNALLGAHLQSAHNNQAQPMGSAFSHQYPISPALSSSTVPASAIPRHLHTDSNMQSGFSPSNANNNVLTDNASILTLASSSKRRRRSMDTDASVRAMAPSSVWGGSRESLPLSMLSGHIGSINATNSPAGDTSTGVSRLSIGGLNAASAERTGVYSRDSMGLPPSALASERSSFYAKQQIAGDAKSLRSITNMKPDDARSVTNSNIDTRSFSNLQSDAKSTHDVASIRSIAPSEVRIPAGYGGRTDGRNDSISGSIGAGSAIGSPVLPRQLSNAGLPPTSVPGQSRRSSEWREVDSAQVESALVQGVDGQNEEMT